VGLARTGVGIAARIFSKLSGQPDQILDWNNVATFRETATAKELLLRMSTSLEIGADPTLENEATGSLCF
jgi:hypothetical protein